MSFNRVPFAYPSVRVIVPVYNGEDTLAQCLKALTTQSYPKALYRIIVVDNNSKDTTKEIASSFDIEYYFYDKLQNPAASRNFGLGSCSQDLYIFTDSDCIAPRHFILKHVMAHMRLGLQDCAFTAVGGGIKGINTSIWALCDDLCSWFYFSHRLPPRIEKNFCPTANLSVKGSYLREYGAFHPGLRYAEDLHFCRELRNKGSRIFFEPSAFVLHINRPSFRKFILHRKEWAASHKYQLHNHLVPSHRHFIVHQLFAAARSVALILIMTAKAKRWLSLSLLPMILMGQMVDYFSRIGFEADFRRRSESLLKEEDLRSRQNKERQHG